MAGDQRACHIRTRVAQVITSAYVKRLVLSNSNHGTFAFVQITSLLLYGFVGDFDRVKAVLNEIYTGTYQNQISANRDQ